MKVELIEKAVEIVGDKQLLVNIVSRRVNQLGRGADPFVQTTPDMGNGDIALVEIIEGKIIWREATEEELAGHAELIEEAEESAPQEPEAAQEVTITL